MYLGCMWGVSRVYPRMYLRRHLSEVYLECIQCIYTLDKPKINCPNFVSSRARFAPGPVCIQCVYGVYPVCIWGVSRGVPSMYLRWSRCIQCMEAPNFYLMQSAGGSLIPCCPPPPPPRYTPGYMSDTPDTPTDTPKCHIWHAQMP
jgi:hypothetical protein